MVIFIKKLILVSLLFIFLGVPVFLTFGAELKYSTILDLRDEKILIRFGGLENPDNFLCEIIKLSCENLGKNIPIEVNNFFNDKEPLSQKIKDIKFDRQKATRVTLSPNEQWLAYYQPALVNDKNRERSFVLLDIENKNSPKKFTLTGQVNYWDLLSEDLRLFYFSPDGSKLIYLDDRTGYPSLYLVELDKKKKNLLPGRQITQRKYTIADFLLWDSETVYFSANRESNHQWSLYRYNLNTGAVKKIANQVSYSQRMHRLDSSDNQTNRLLFLQIHNDSLVPALYDPLLDKILYFPNLPANPPIKGYKETEIVLGGINSVLLEPTQKPSNAKLPLLVWLHGGPYRQTSLGFHSYFSYAVYDWLLSRLAQSGILVLKVDYRGSYGYGRLWAEAIHNQVGQGDVADVIKAINELKKIKNIDSVYLVGNSYGGYLSLKTIVEHPKIFQGAMSINGVTDWFTLLEKLEKSIFNLHFDGLLEEKNSQLYYQADIGDRVKNLSNQKIILAHSENDQTVPISQVDYLQQIFQLRRKPLEIVRYPDEDHVFKKVSSLEDICHRLAKMIKTEANCSWSDKR